MQRVARGLERCPKWEHNGLRWMWAGGADCTCTTFMVRFQPSVANGWPVFLVRVERKTGGILICLESLPLIGTYVPVSPQGCFRMIGHLPYLGHLWPLRTEIVATGKMLLSLPQGGGMGLLVGGVLLGNCWLILRSRISSCKNPL